MVWLLNLRLRYWLRRRDRAHAQAGRLAVQLWEAVPDRIDGPDVPVSDTGTMEP